MTDDAKRPLLSPTMYMGKDRIEALQPDPEPEVNTEEEAVVENNPEESTFKKRYGDLRRFHQKAVDDLKAEIEKLKAEKKATPDWTPPKSDEELKRWKNEHPEAYAIFASIAHNQTKLQSQKVQELSEKLAEAELSVKREQAVSVIRELHPDWDDIRSDEAFHEWASAQPKNIQEAIYENETDGYAAARALDLYKLDAGFKSKASKSPQSKDDIKKAAAELGVKAGGRGTDKDGKQKKIWTFKEIEIMSLLEFEKHEQDILEAQREGRIVAG